MVAIATTAVARRRRRRRRKRSREGGNLWLFKEKSDRDRAMLVWRVRGGEKRTLEVSSLSQ